MKKGIAIRYLKPSDQNYIKTTTYLKDDSNATTSLKTVKYFDGLGHLIQTVQQKTDYLTNAASDCKYYYMLGDNLTQNGYYAASTLYVTKTTDEDNKVLFEFKDKLGRVVLQRQVDGTDNFDTYYVYDDFGNLRWVLPPIVSSTTDSNYG